MRYARMIATGPHWFALTQPTQAAPAATPDQVKKTNMYLGIISEIACFITALICLAKDKSFAWRGMILLMLVTCITEISGALMSHAHHHNQWLYNISIVFEACLTSLMFNTILGKYINSKPIILNGLALMLLLYIYELFDHGFFVFNNITATVMSVVFVIYSFYYYFLLIKDEAYVALQRAAPFWWITGALFFYFGSTAVNLFYPFLVDVKMGGHNITYYIFPSLSVILYSCWIYSFICRKWATTSEN